MIDAVLGPVSAGEITYAPGLSRLPDGSWLSRFGGIPVRVIDAQVTVTTSAGHATAGGRLVTTLLDPVDTRRRTLTDRPWG